MGVDVNAMPWQFYSREITGNHCIGGWVGPRAGLDWCSKPRLPPGFDPQASRYIDYAIPTCNKG